MQSNPSDNPKFKPGQPVMVKFKTTNSSYEFNGKICFIKKCSGLHKEMQYRGHVYSLIEETKASGVFEDELEYIEPTNIEKIIYGV